MKNWTLFKALFLPLFTRFIFVLFFLYGIYAFIDYSLRIQELTKTTAGSFEILLFYLYSLSKRLEFLLPLSLLLSMVRTLMVMSEKNEIVGFLACGISLKQISYPFFVLSALTTFTLLMNYELVNPKARRFIDDMEQKISLHRSEMNIDQMIVDHKLSNGTACLYIKDPTYVHRYFDFYWFENSSSLWHAKEIIHQGDSFEGYYVDHLERNGEGQFIKTESYEEYSFVQLDGISFEQSALLPSKEYSSLSSLVRELSKPLSAAGEEILSLFYYRCVICLFPFIIFCAVIPYCTRFSKAKEYYFLFMFYLFGFICFFTLMNAFYILSTQGVLQSALAILGMPTVLALIFGLQLKRRYA